MNPSTSLATTVVDELVKAGVREAVLSPGSRNAPLSYALVDADRAGRLRLHVRIDERGAGFLALGLAKASKQPVAVVTTSGTAAVNLHPAMVEADYSGVPVIALTADRPAEMRGVGANQTIDQTELFGVSVRHFAELSVDTCPTEAEQRALLRTAVAAATTAAARPGPVHLNVGLREPLVPDVPAAVPAVPAGPADPAAPLGMRDEPASGHQQFAHAGVREGGEDGSGVELSPEPRRTVVVAGDGAGRAAYELARAGGWPLLAEPSSGARFGPNALGAYRLFLDDLGDDVERVVVLGRPTLSRPVARLLARPDVDVVRAGRFHWAGPAEVEPDSWSRRWSAADVAARTTIAAVLGSQPLTGPAIAAAVSDCLPPRGLLVAGSSSAVRDLDLAPPWTGKLPQAHRLVLANRGASGIDGTVSTALGAALAHQASLPDGAGDTTPGESRRPAYALMGDLTFLHDSNGLVLGPDEPRPDLTIVVVNDDGGGLFTLLEQGEPERAETFERVFGTPHHVDISALCAATSTPYVRATTIDELRLELAHAAEGIRVVEVPVDRSRTRALHARLKAAVLDAIADLRP